MSYLIAHAQAVSRALAEAQQDFDRTIKRLPTLASADFKYGTTHQYRQLTEAENRQINEDCRAAYAEALREQFTAEAERRECEAQSLRSMIVTGGGKGRMRIGGESAGRPAPDVSRMQNLNPLTHVVPCTVTDGVLEVDLTTCIAVRVGPFLLRSGLDRGTDNWRKIAVGMFSRLGWFNLATVVADNKGEYPLTNFCFEAD